MAKRYDINDFDINTVVSALQGASGNKEPSFLDKYGAGLLTGVIGAVDNYQNYKLSEKIDDTNFQNTVDTAKLKIQAAEQMQRYEETQPMYNQLKSQGYQFDPSQTGENITDSNYAIANSVFGNQAWNTVKSQFSDKLVSQDLNSFNDWELAVSEEGGYNTNKENTDAVKKYYKSIVKDKVSYVSSGQAYNYNKFKAALDTLKEMRIDIDVADAGLLSKISGSLRRRIDARDEEIDMFRSTYLTKPAKQMKEAALKWTKNKSSDEIGDAVTKSGLGYWGLLNAEQKQATQSMPESVKKAFSNSIEKHFNTDNPVTAESFQRFFNISIYNTNNPTAYTLAMNRAKWNAIVNNPENKEQLEKTYASDIQNFPSLTTEDQANSLMSYNKEIERLNESISPLLKKRTDEGLTSLEENKLMESEQLLQLNELGVANLSKTGTAVDTFIIQKKLEEISANYVTTSASWHWESINANNTPTEDKKVNSVSTQKDIKKYVLNTEVQTNVAARMLATTSPDRQNLTNKPDAGNIQAFSSLLTSRLNALGGDNYTKERAEAFATGNNDPLTKNEISLLSKNLAVNRTAIGQSTLLSIGVQLSNFEDAFDNVIAINNYELSQDRSGYFGAGKRIGTSLAQELKAQVFINNNTRIISSENILGGRTPKSVNVSTIDPDLIPQQIYNILRERDQSENTPTSLSDNLGKNDTPEKVVNLLEESAATDTTENQQELVTAVKERYNLDLLADNETIRKQNKVFARRRASLGLSKDTNNLKDLAKEIENNPELIQETQIKAAKLEKEYLEAVTNPISRTNVGGDDLLRQLRAITNPEYTPDINSARDNTEIKIPEKKNINLEIIEKGNNVSSQNLSGSQSTLDSFINFLIPSATASEVKNEPEVRKETSISRAVNIEKNKQISKWEDRETMDVPVAAIKQTDPAEILFDRGRNLIDREYFKVSTTDPISWIKNNTDTVMEAVAVYHTALKQHNAETDTLSDTYQYKPLVQAMTWAHKAYPDKIPALKKLYENKINAKDSDNLLNTIESSGNTEKVTTYAAKVSKMSKEEKQIEFNKQYQIARKIPVSTDADMVANAIAYRQLQSIYGKEDNKIVSRKLDGTETTVNDKVETYYGSLKYVNTPEFRSRSRGQINMLKQVLDNFKTNAPSSLLAQR